VIYIPPKSQKRIRAHWGWALGGRIGWLKVVGLQMSSTRTFPTFQSTMPIKPHGSINKCYWRYSGDLFVAPMIKTFFLLLMPSISVRSWLMTLSAAPPPSPTLPPRDLAIESSSSKNRTHGAAARDYNQ